MTDPKMVSEREAVVWRNIARRMANPKYVNHGLCDALGQEYATAREERIVYDTAHWRLQGHLARVNEMWSEWYQAWGCGSYLAPLSDRNVRVLAALFLALEAEED